MLDGVKIALEKPKKANIIHEKPLWRYTINYCAHSICTNSISRYTWRRNVKENSHMMVPTPYMDIVEENCEISRTSTVNDNHTNMSNSIEPGPLDFS
jgi:hypothetical protein